MLDFSDLTILCVGDVMLDRYLYGDATRLSPEAPVPIVRLGRSVAVPGGAGNVARNIAALGGRAVLMALTGEDAAGAELDALLAKEPNLLPALLRSHGRRSTAKLRIIAAHQHVVRVDEEDAAAATPEEEAALLGVLGQHVKAANVLLLSDYGKGVLTPAFIGGALAAARACGIPCVADPKGRDYARYAGVDVLTPNARELAEATGLPTQSDAECEAAARALLASVPLGAVLATRSERGMMLVRPDRPAEAVPTLAKEVFDVSGAGDTVIAALALALAAGRPLEGAMRIANAAAGVVVGKLGTAACSAAELDHALRAAEGATGEVLSWSAARRMVEGWRAQGLSVGFANGCFDVLHAGHVRLLREARWRCDRLVVALNDDASVTRLKGPKRPVNPLSDRAAVIGALAAVDAVVSFPKDTPLELIRELRPHVLFKGADYRPEEVVGAADVQGWGGRLELLDLLPGRSTTAILKRGR
jgi:D-beta-D-heptose 7-phosphate kinase/D-beta-D-heptose 1-phosphate adenosyltransferase